MAAGDHALVFTQFREMGHLLERQLAERLRTPILFLHGGTPPKQRDAMVFRRCRDHGVPVAVVLAGGYAADVGDTVEMHTNTYLALRETFC